MTLIITRYARALYDYADDHNCLPEVMDDLRDLNHCLEHSGGFKKLFKNPLIAKKVFFTFFNTLVAQGLLSSPHTRHFLRLLIDKKRLALLKDIIMAFLHMATLRNKGLPVQVMSAYPLTKTQRGALQKTLKERMKRDIILEEKIDPEVIGGIVIQMEGYRIDSTLQTYLNRLHKALGA